MAEGSTAPKAADLPDGTVVIGDNVVYIKNHPTPSEPWRSTRGGYCGDWQVDAELAEPAARIVYPPSTVDQEEWPNGTVVQAADGRLWQQFNGAAAVRLWTPILPAHFVLPERAVKHPVTRLDLTVPNPD